MKICLYMMLLFPCIGGLRAEKLTQIDFTGNQGIGWQNGISNGQSSEWSIDCSKLTSTAGTACVSEQDFFIVKGCTGTFVFRTKKIALCGAEQVTVSVQVGGNSPDFRLEFEVANVKGNRMMFAGQQSDKQWLPQVQVTVGADSLELEVEANHLVPEDCFSFDDIVVEIKGERARIVCGSSTDTLFLTSRYDKNESGLQIPFVIHNRDRSGMPLIIKQIDFYGDSTSLSRISSAVLNRGENSLEVEGTKSSEKIKFYDKNNLFYLPHGDSAVIGLYLWGHRNLVEDNRTIQLCFNKQSFVYADESCRLWRSEECLIPPVVTNVKACGVTLMGYEHSREAETILTWGVHDENYNIDRDSSIWCNVTVRNNNTGEVVYVIEREVRGTESLSVELSGKADYRVAWNGNDSLLLSGTDKTDVYREEFSQLPTGWLGTENWEIRDGYLRHRNIDVNGTSRFMYPVKTDKLSKSTFVWSFGMCSEGWVSSSVNYARYYLLATSDLKNSFYFTTDASSKERILVAEMFGEKRIMWQGGRVGQENEEWMVEITYHPSGRWDIKMGRPHQTPLLVGKATQRISSSFWQSEMLSGILFKYTSASRSAKFRALPLAFSYIGETTPPALPKAKPGDVVFNEIMYKPAEGMGLPNEEYVELYNLKEYSLVLDSLVFKDRGNERAYLCDTLPGHGFLILCKSSGAEELQMYGKTVAVKRFALIDTGATLVLASRKNELFDSVWYRPEWITDKSKQKGGYSLEKRSPELPSQNANNWQASFDEKGGTPGSANSNGTEPPTPEVVNRGDVLISELMFDANPTEAEYIELYNNSDRNLCLSDLFIAKRGKNGDLQSIKQLSDSCHQLPPGEYVWVTPLPDEVCGSYFYCNPDNCCVVSTQLAYANTGGTVVILNQSRDVIDELAFHPKMHTIAQSNKRGISLERLNVGKGAEDTGVWLSAGGDGSDGYGSPGMPNRAKKETDSEVESMALKIFPAHTFTPDGDGVEDEVKIIMLESALDYNVFIGIYNSAGQLVKTVADNIPSSGTTEFTWDGTNSSKAPCKAGIYSISVKIVYADKTEKTYMKAKVLSR